MSVKINYSTVGFVNWGQDFKTLYNDLLNWRKEHSLKKNFDKNKKLILDYLATHSEVKSQDIAEVLGLGISRTKVYLSELVDANLIIRLGANKNRIYKLK